MFVVYVKNRSIMNYKFAVSCLFFLSAFPVFAQQSPDFTQYPAEIRQTKPKKPDFKTNPQTKIHQKAINNSVKKGVNFAGHYILTALDCGAQCVGYAITDAETGKIFLPSKLQNLTLGASKSASFGEYRTDSRLLILNSAAAPEKRLFDEWNGAEIKEIAAAAVAVKPVTPQILPIFNSAVAQISGRTNVPVLLPSLIPDPKFLPKILPLNEGATELSFYSAVITAKDSEYALSVDTTPDCAGRPNCNYGRISGIKNSAAAPVSTTAIEFSRADAKTVALAGGIKGFYIPATDNPRAVTGTRLFWLDGQGNQYAVSLKRAPLEDITALANSLIENAPVK